jgi:predicted nucleotide-binding protein
MTVIQELISEFEEIKKTKCKTLQEVMFFDGVLAIIESKYIEKEKQQIVEAYTDGTNYNKFKKLIITPDDEDYKLGKQYYNETFNK